MRKLCNAFLLTLFVCCGTYLPAFAQEEVDMADSTGLPGDHFSLEAALDLFKKAESLEAFEKMLNQEDNGVNNLDLNEDGDIDYIRVIDNTEGDVHAIVLQVPVSEKESQDIAVIEIEKTGAEEATLQIVGDADVYGDQTLVEPFQEEVKKGGKGGPSVNTPRIRIVVNVWLWPSVRYVYHPGYVVYTSPWRWGYYPGWFRPWRPHPWRWYHVRVRPHRVHYHVVSTHRVVHAHGVYAPRRTHSTVVHTRTTTTVKHRGGGTTTRTTKSTTVQGRKGRGATKQKTTTTHQGPRGNKATKSTTKTTKRGRRN